MQTYTGVTLKAANKSLTLVSADKVSTVVISGADCAHDGAIVRCMGGRFSLLQDGERHTVPFKTATFYFNLTDQDQPLPLSTTKIARPLGDLRRADGEGDLHNRKRQARPGVRTMRSFIDYPYRRRIAPAAAASDGVGAARSAPRRSAAVRLARRRTKVAGST